MQPIRVGLVGANSERGWSARTHLPALASLDAFEIVALCTTSPESAQVSAERYGARHALTDPAALFGLEDIDLAVISVRAPGHEALTRAAFNAGKHVLCEWPLGTDSAQSASLLALAEATDRRHFVGLQGHASPAALHARSLIDEGFVGDILSVTMSGAHSVWGETTPADSDYILDRRNGVTLASILGGHAIDMLCALVGEFSSVAGIVTNRRRSAISGDGKTRLAKTSPDQLLFTGELAGGAPVSVHIQGGVREADHFSLDVRGTDGTLRLSTHSLPELLPPALAGTRAAGAALAPIPLPAACRSAPAQLGDGPAVNVAQLYAMIGADLREGGDRAPDFARGLRRRRLLDAVARSADEGLRVAL